MKYKRYLLIPFLMAVYFLMLCTNVCATSEDEHNYVKLDLIEVNIGYDLKDINIERHEEKDRTIVEIRDKAGNFLKSIEEVKKNTDYALYGCGQESDRDIIVTFSVGPTRIAVRADCTVYDECGSWGHRTHVIRVHGADMYIVSSGFSYLENERARVIGETRVQCSGVVAVDLNAAINAGFNVEFFKSAGFNISGTGSSTFRARKSFEETVDFR